jgi:hypothetical protein
VKSSDESAGRLKLEDAESSIYGYANVVGLLPFRL